MTFKKGNIPYNKGKQRPEMLGDKNPSKRPEVRAKISKANKGHKWCWTTGKTKETDKRIAASAIKSSETNKKIFAEGKRKCWNEGLTAKIDERVAAQGKNTWNKDISKEEYLTHYENNKMWNTGLTKETSESIKLGAEKLSIIIKEQYEKGRISSFKGKTHTDKTKKILSLKASLRPHTNNNISKSGYREDLGHFVRSSWEANICRLLKFFGKEYKYEPQIFELTDILRYKPDIFIPKNNLYFEIKGYMTNEAKRKVHLFKEKYPELKLVVIEKEVYKKLYYQYGSLIPNWEFYKP